MAEAMKEQMELFEDGGLEQDGGTVDPVSGNEVPMGSSQEEVRDDIPAQLSEGEFVFPADVVRFIGLSKLMKLRQQAKAGLKRMEDMGQMGNSEEAILPDDIPFDMDDLDLEDDTLELQEGGYASDINVQQGQTFANQDFSVPPIETQPIQPTPTDDYVSPIQAPTPIEAPVDPLPPFNVFVPPVADEYKEYVNDEGIIINVPFFRGQVLPGYTVPKGFKLKEAAPEEEGITEDALTDITEPEQDDRESRIKREEEEEKQRNRSYDNVVSQIMQDNPGASLEDITKKIKDGEATVNIFGKTIKAPGSAKSLNLTDEENEAIRKAAEKAAQKALTEKAIKEAEKRSKIESAAQAIADRKTKAAELEAKAKANRKRLADEAAQRRREQSAAERREQDRKDAQAAREAEKEQTRAQKEGYTRDTAFEKATGFRRAKGGTIEKPKKKMKRGGVASKK